MYARGRVQDLVQGLSCRDLLLHAMKPHFPITFAPKWLSALKILVQLYNKHAGGGDTDFRDAPFLR